MTNSGSAQGNRSPTANPQQLVMRRDSSDAMVKVGWAVEMPLGRFEHLQLLAECDHCEPMHPQHQLFDIYRRACQHARRSNIAMLERQRQQLTDSGWLPIIRQRLPQLQDLSCQQEDEFGSLRLAAMQTLFQLSANHPFVWCVLDNGCIVFVQSSLPPKSMDELESQVWKHHCLSRMQQMPGQLLSGKLVVKESGLWFIDE